MKKNYEYLGVAFDSKVESFRNDIFKEYKSSRGIDKDILGQFSLAEKATELLGITLLSMDQYEADDAIASVCSVFKNKNIPFRSFEIRKRDEKTLGELFCFFILETILIGKALKIDPFDQPAVELIKKETKKILI